MASNDPQNQAQVRYRLIRRLGSGATGSVWLAEDRLLQGAPVAIKLLDEERRESHAQAFRREFATLASLRHPNLVEAIEFGTDPATGRLFFSMEHVAGRNLTEAARDDGPEKLIAFAVEALRALAFLHDFGVIHRDLKPANLLVRDQAKLDCNVVLLDFGLAQELGPASDPTSQAPVGTLPYIAPELFEGQPAGPRSDLYSLGAVLFEALHGEPLHTFDDDDLPSFVERVKRGRHAPPSSRTGLGPKFEEWVRALVSPDPADRPAKAREALARLNDACSDRHALETDLDRRARLASGPPPGREKEVQRVLSDLDPERGPRFVWLCGGEGSGKTRVLRYLSSKAVRDGWDVELIGTTQWVDDIDADFTDELLSRLRGRASKQPTLVLVDELETLEGKLATVLDRLAREHKAPAVQVVGAARPAPIQSPRLRKLLADAGTVPTVSRVDLEPLDARAVGKVAERASGVTKISKRRVDWLLRASQGTPLVLENLLVGQAWERESPDAARFSLGDAVGQRMVSLQEAGRAWLAAVCVLGKDSAERIVADVAGLDSDGRSRGSLEALATGLATRRRGVWSPDSETVQRYVLSNLDQESRNTLHRRAIQALRKSGEQRADDWKLARHHAAVGNAREACNLAAQSARLADEAGDPSVAADRYRFALVQLGRKRGQRRYELRMAIGNALRAAGRIVESIRSFSMAARVAPSDELANNARINRSKSLLAAGRVAEAGDSLAGIAESARLRSDDRQLAEALKLEATVFGRLNREREAAEAFRRAAEAFRQLKDPIQAAECLHLLAHNESILGLPAAGDHFNEALDTARLHGAKQTESLTVLSFARHCRREGRLQDAANLAEQVLRLAEETRDSRAYRRATYDVGQIASELGNYDRTVELMTELEIEARQYTDPTDLALAKNLHSETLLKTGRPTEAAQGLRELLEGKVAVVEPRKIDFAKGTLAEALLESPKADAAEIERLLDEAIRGCEQRGNEEGLASLLVVELERRIGAGDEAGAERVIDRIAGLVARDSEPVDFLPEYGIRYRLAHGELRLGQGRHEQARKLALAAAELADERDMPGLGARALALAADVVQRSGGESDEVAGLFEQGRALLDDAAQRIGDAEMRRDFLARSVFHRLREPSLDGGRAADRRVLALYDMIRALNSEDDAESLLERILDMALSVVQAERGMILLLDPETRAPTVRLARNLEHETIEDAEAFSRGVVARAGEGESILAIDAGHDDRFRELRSVSTFGIRSLMCVPLRCRGVVTGTVYIDNRHAGPLFTRDDLRFVEAFADHAALALDNARDRARLEQENTELREAVQQRARFDNIIGRSPQMQRVFELIRTVADSDLPALILGESGTGKELVASAIHFNSPRRDRIFLTESCAAIPETLLESELFGHERGAFTGADQQRLGLFEQAHGGTLFLDEVGDMPAAMQARLLRVLQEGELRRVGGNRTIEVDVRVVAATHRDLEAEVAAGRFREDLLYRLQVLPVALPPLRERAGDIPLLVEHFLEQSARQREQPKPAVDAEVMAIFERYAWPGNVRQLENVLSRVALIAGTGRIDRAVLASDPELTRTLLAEGESAREPVYSLARNERDKISSALRAADGNRNRAARMLGVSRATIYRKIKQYGLS